MVLTAHRGCYIVEVPPVRLVAKRDASGQHAGSRRLLALSHIPGMADVHPWEPDPLSPFHDGARGPGDAVAPWSLSRGSSSLFEQKKTTEPSLYPFGGFSLRWWFTDFLTQIFADFPLNSSTLAPYVLLRLSRQIFQLFNKVDSAGKFLPLRRIHTDDISLGSDMLLLLLFLSYRRDTYYWLYSSPKPKTVRTGKTGPINPTCRHSRKVLHQNNF